MYKMTGDTSYLFDFEQRFKSIISQRDDKTGIRDVIRKRVTLGWSSNKYSKGKNHAWIVHSGMVLYPVVEFMALIENRPKLEREFSGFVNDYYEEVVRMTMDFEEDWNPKVGFYNYRYKPGQILPYNQALALGRVFVILQTLARQRGDSRAVVFKKRAVQMAQYFQNNLRKVGHRFEWNYGINEPRPEDSSHAGIDVDFVVLAAKYRIVFTQNDVVRMYNSYVHMARPQGLTEYVNGAGRINWLESLSCGRMLEVAKVRKFPYFHCKQVFERYLSNRSLESIPYNIGNNFIMGYIMLLKWSRVYEKEQKL